MEATHVQRVIAAVAVRVHDAAGSDFPLDHGHQRPAPGVVDDLGIDLPLAREDAEDHHLAGSATTSLAFADAAEVAFVQFRGSCEGFMLDSGQVIGNGLSGFPVVQGGRVGLHSQQISR